MADKSYEKHIEDLIKMRSEIRKAVNAYKNHNYGEEVYFMVRAEAFANALGIENDEFLNHKAIVEKEEEMQDCLMMGRECIDTINEWNNFNGNLYTLIFIDTADFNYDEKLFTDGFKAEEEYKKLVQKYFDMDDIKKDSWGKSLEECLRDKEAFFGDNINHNEIYISLRKYTMI